MKIVPVTRTQHLVLRLHAGDIVPDALVAELRARQVTGGWLRLSGILADVELRAFSPEIEGPGGTKRVTGQIEAVTLDGNIGVADGDVALDLRVVLARETDRGLETIAGQLLRARVVGVEGSLTVLEETVVPRALDRSTGIRLLREDAIVSASPPVAAPVPTPAASAPHVEAARPSPPPSPPPARPSAPSIAGIPGVPGPAPSAPAVSNWSDAAAASAAAQPANRPTGAPAPLTRPVRRVVESEDGPYPVAGDTVEHFAFGSCEVLKSDGDRLHVRMKDGRIREIAIEMLKVTPLGGDATTEGTAQRYRLNRKA